MGVLFTGCDAGAFTLGSLPEGDRVQLEPGDVNLPLHPPPAIEIFSSGGFAGGGWGNFQIWEDGTVAAQCPNRSHLRGKMSPARVRAVVDTLERARFLMWRFDEDGSCCDCFHTSLTVRRGESSNTVSNSSCDSAELPAKAIKLVMQSLAEHPCGPM